MAYNPNQPRQAGGKFGSTGFQPVKGVSAADVSPAAMAQAKKEVAASLAAAARNKNLTPAQRNYLRALARAQVITRRQKAAALSKQKKAATAKKRAEAQRLAAQRRNPAARASGAAMAKPRSTASARSAGARARPSPAVQARLAQYLKR